MNDPQSSDEREHRLFTLDEANRLLPLFTQWLAEVQLLREAVVNVMESKNEVSGGNGHVHDDLSQTKHDLDTVSQAAGRITELVDMINRTGAELKDLEMGLVDFPYLRGGRTVYLCWMLGEDRIGFWHSLDSGVSGRQPL